MSHKSSDTEKHPGQNVKNVEIEEERNTAENRKNIYDTVEHTESVRSAATTNTSDLEDVSPRPLNNTDDTPDGGYGWFIVLAGFLVNCITFGGAVIWGVYSNAYATMDLQIKGSTAELMTVGTIILASIKIFAPVSPVLFRFGFRFTLIIGSALVALGLLLASFSTKMWHLYLTQGLLFGLGSSIEYMTMTSVTSQWFSKRRGIAMGLSSSGTGVGGLALSPLANYLIHTYGMEWTYRIMTFIAIGVNCIAICLLRSRVKIEKNNRPSLKSAFNFHVLKNINFLIWIFGAGITVTGYIVPVYYVPKYCTSLGIDSARSSLLVGIISSTSAIGRLFLGFFADKFGRLNIFIVGSALAGLFCLLLWPFATTFGSMLAFSILFGLTCGVYYVVAPPIAAEIVGPSNASSGISFLLFATAIASIGPPVSSPILNSGGFLGIQVFSGSTYAFGVILSIILKIRMSGSLFSIT